MKVKSFLESESVANWGVNDLLENRDGRMSIGQRRMIRLRLYEFASCGMILLELILLTIFVVSLLMAFSLSQGFRNLAADIYMMAGIIIPPCIVLIYGYYGVCLIRDMSSGTVKQDCGNIKLETRRLPPRFQKRKYVVLDGKRRYELSQYISADLHDDERLCIYYAPQTRLITAVDTRSAGV